MNRQHVTINGKTVHFGSSNGTEGHAYCGSSKTRRGGWASVAMPTDQPVNCKRCLGIRNTTPAPAPAPKAKDTKVIAATELAQGMVVVIKDGGRKKVTSVKNHINGEVLIVRVARSNKALFVRKSAKVRVEI